MFQPLFRHSFNYFTLGLSHPHLIPFSIGAVVGCRALGFFHQVPSMGQVLIASFIILSSIKRLTKRNNCIRGMLLAGGLGALLGLSWASYQATKVIDGQRYLFDNQAFFSGVVSSIPLQGRQTAFDFNVTQVCLMSEKCFRVSAKIKLFWRNPTFELSQGDQLVLTAQFKKPWGHANPRGSDQAKSWFLSHYSAQGNVKTIQHHQPAPWSIRQRLKNKIDLALQDLPTKGIFQALILGVQHDITQEQWTVFRQTGTSHLMAISGLHIGLVAGAMYWLMFKGWCRTSRVHRIPAQLPSALTAILFSLLYSHCAGWSIPTQRACIMIVLFMLSLLARQLVPKSQVFCASLVGVLVIDPFAPFKAGFWLSYIAVFLLLLGGWLNPNKNGVKGWLLPHIWLFGGLLPLSLLFFGQSSWSSMLANVLAIPWMSFLVVPIALLGAALINFSTIGELFLQGAHLLFVPLNAFLNWLSASVTTFEASIEGSSAIIAVVGAILLMIPKTRKLKLLAVGFFVPMFLPLPNPVKAGEFQVHVLDVGQGTAVVLETASHLVVYDTGPKYDSGFDSGAHIIHPFLKSIKAKPIAYTIISHADNDHLGGLESLSRLRRLNRVLTSDLSRIPFANEACRQGQTWELDGVHFEILHPGRVLSKKTNNQSCVMMVSAQDQKILLTGDIDSSVEQGLQTIYGKALQAAVLLVPHHGSLTSSSEEFIHAVNPLFAAITVGHNNLYGHPKEKVLERYENKKVKVLRTDTSGCLSFHFKPNQVKVLSQWRTKLTGPWQALVGH